MDGDQIILCSNEVPSKKPAIEIDSSIWREEIIKAIEIDSSARQFGGRKVAVEIDSSIWREESGPDSIGRFRIDSTRYRFGLE